MKSHQLRMSALAVAISMALTSSPALAQQIQNSSTQQVSLSSQNLDQALIQWANTYNTQLVVDQSIVKGLQAPTVSGKYTARQALNLLLAGSGLQVLESNGNYVVTKPALSSNPNNAPKLSSVVVSASGFEQDLAQAPASISVISREELETKQFRDLAEALKDVEGIDVRGSTGKTGGLNISIRGLPSDYTLVLIDGRRQNTAGEVTPNGFGDALTSLIPPLSAIERIEVIRGPMSTLYGSDALGGVINIITRKVGKTWGGSVQLETGIPENSDEGGTQKQSFYVSGPLVENTVGLAIRGSLFRRDESTLEPSTPGGTISRRGPSPVETRQHNLGFRLTATPNISNDLWLDFESYRTTYDNDECQLGTRDFLNCNTGAPSNTASGYADSLSFNRQQFVLGQALLCTVLCAATFMFSFLIPMLQLIAWAWQSWKEQIDMRYFEFAANSLILAILAASLATMLALSLSWIKRRNPDPTTIWISKLGTLGYALPGVVLAVGIYIPIAWLDNALGALLENFKITELQMLKGTLITMLLALAARFMAVAFQSTDSSMQRITKNQEDVCSSLGLNTRQTLVRLHLPLLKPGLLAAFLMVMIDVMKEMPITLMTRQYGWDTLAVRVYQLTSESLWVEAASPALIIALLGLIPVVYLIGKTNQTGHSA